MQNQWKSFEKMTGDLNLDLFWGQKWDKNGPLRPIFSTPLKILAMSMWSNTDVKPVKTVRENDQRLQYWLIWGANWSQNWASEAHILHTFKSSYNQHVKQYWCEISRNILRKWPKTGIWDLFWSPKIGPMRPTVNTSLKVPPMHISSKTDSRKPVFWLIWRPKTFKENIWKPIYWLTLALFGTKKGWKIWPTGVMFHIHLKIPMICT